MATAEPQAQEREPRASRNLEAQERADQLAELRASIAGEWQTAEDLLLSVRQMRRSDVLAAGFKSVDEEATQQLGDHLGDLDVDDSIEIESAVVRGKHPNQVVSYVGVDEETGKQVKGICELPKGMQREGAKRNQRRTSREQTGKSDAKS